MYYQKTNLTETLIALKKGKLNLISFLNSLCDRIDAVEPHIHALIPESGRRHRLLKEASTLLTTYPDPLQRPPLFGIPVGIKDIFRVDGFVTACGSKLPAHLFDGPEASVVAQLKNAGALILGKTVTTEFAYFEPGPTCNPNNTGFTPGGSSSGSAAAVAAGFTPLAFGTQTIGSIIRPAAYCGVVGVKPSTLSISANGVIPFSPTLDHVGFFTHDLEGAQLIASLLCNESLPTYNQTAVNPTMGIPDRHYLSQANSIILAHFNEIVAQLQKNNIKIIETTLFSDIEVINSLHKQLAAREFAMTHKSWFKEYSALYSPHSVRLIKEGADVPDKVNKQILEFRSALRTQVEALMQKEGVDVWLSPATLTLPPEGLFSTGSPLMNLPWTFTGHPVITIPYGKNSDNLPFGLQFTGRMNALGKLLADVKFLQEVIQ